MDDNGAGVVAMLEVAKQLTAMNKKGVQRKNTVIFVSFDIEEQGKLFITSVLYTEVVQSLLDWVTVLPYSILPYSIYLTSLFQPLHVCGFCNNVYKNSCKPIARILW